MPTDADGPALSFVIPIWNEARGIASLLKQLAREFPGAQRIVVDGGSDDGSVPAALPHAHAVLLGARGRAAQMNLGAASAQGHHLCFLHADTLPEFDQAALAAGPWRCPLGLLSCAPGRAPPGTERDRLVHEPALAPDFRGDR